MLTPQQEKNSANIKAGLAAVEKELKKVVKNLQEGHRQTRIRSKGPEHRRDAGRCRLVRHVPRRR